MHSRPLLGIAHRGASAHAPENTLEAIGLALELGARAIEIDVHQVDGELLVFHDRRLERLTQQTGLLEHCTREQARALRIHGRAEIPSLPRVLEAVRGQALLNIELKGARTALPVSGLLREALEAGWRAEDLLVSSFRHGELAVFGALLPEVRTGAVIYGAPLDHALCAEELQAWSIHAALDFVDEPFLQDARRRGLRVFVYTPNHADDLEYAAALGVDGVYCDYPERVLEGWPQPDTRGGWAGLPLPSSGERIRS